jgi:hypothetical protein
VTPGEVSSEFADVLTPLNESSSGVGDLGSVKQIQIQGNFNPTQNFAYTLGGLEAVSFKKP